ncbi:MAG: hypothetical protein ACP5PJ_04415, partial [Acidimicrobiales bacterium]
MGTGDVGATCAGAVGTSTEFVATGTWGGGGGSGGRKSRSAPLAFAGGGAALTGPTTPRLLKYS